MISSFKEAEREIQKLRDELDSYKKGNIDARKRRIVNLSASVNASDAVIRQELYQFVCKEDIPTIRRESGLVVNNVWARAKLTGLQVVGTDVLDHPYAVQLPVGKKLHILWTYVSAKIGPTISDYAADFLISTDNMATYNSIYPAGTANKLVIPAGQNHARVDTLETTEILTDSFFSVDILAADGVVSGVELLILWELRDI